jgi:hypothetical protein
MGKPLGMRPIKRKKRRCKDSIKVDLRQREEDGDSKVFRNIGVLLTRHYKPEDLELNCHRH